MLLGVLFSNLVIAVLYDCMFRYVLIFSPDETLGQGQNASRYSSFALYIIITNSIDE